MATTTPNYGWDVPTSTDYVKDGATAIETLGDDIDATLYSALGGAYPGLRLVKSQVIGTGVSSVAVTSAFSTTYKNYVILISGGVGSAASADIRFIFTGSTASYYSVLAYANWALTGANLLANGNNTANWPFVGEANTNYINLAMQIQDPFETKYSRFSCDYTSVTNTGRGSGLHTVASSYTGFTLTPSTGTLTGGTIYVYGYGAS